MPASESACVCYALEIRLSFEGGCEVGTVVSVGPVSGRKHPAFEGWRVKGRTQGKGQGQKCKGNMKALG